eukprot:2629424-Amphidinium_carterae.2
MCLCKVRAHCQGGVCSEWIMRFRNARVRSSRVEILSFLGMDSARRSDWAVEPLGLVKYLRLRVKGSGSHERHAPKYHAIHFGFTQTPYAPLKKIRLTDVIPFFWGVPRIPLASAEAEVTHKKRGAHAPYWSHWALVTVTKAADALLLQRGDPQYIHMAMARRHDRGLRCSGSGKNESGGGPARVRRNASFGPHRQTVVLQHGE